MPWCRRTGKRSGSRAAGLGRLARVEKRYLFTPGPTPVPPEVLAALAAPIVHHRSPDFRPILERCLARLREVCRTERSAPVHRLRHGRLRVGGANLVSPGERHLVVSAGSFGERWVAMTAAFGADVDHLRYAWGETPAPDDSARAAAGRRGEGGVGRAVGDLHRRRRRLQAIAAAAATRRTRRRRRRLEPGRGSVRDGRVGARRRRLRLAEGADDAARPRARRRRLRAALARPAARRASTSTGSGRATAQVQLDAAFTPPSRSSARSTWRSGSCSRRGSSVVRAPRPPRPRRRAGVKAMGLELFSPDEDRSAVVTAVRTPDGVDAAEIVSALRDRFGITIAAGQGELKGKIFRLGHIGWFDVFDITAQLAAVELVLAELGADIERGAAVAARRSRRTSRRRVTARMVLVRETIARGGRRAPPRPVRRRRRRRLAISRRSSAATTRSSSARRRSSPPS